MRNLLTGSSKEASEIVRLLGFDPGLVAEVTFKLAPADFAVLTIGMYVDAGTGLQAFEYLTKRFKLVQIEDEAEQC